MKLRELGSGDRFQLVRTGERFRVVDPRPVYTSRDGVSCIDERGFMKRLHAMCDIRQICKISAQLGEVIDG